MLSTISIIQVHKLTDKVLNNRERDYQFLSESYRNKIELKVELISPQITAQQNSGLNKGRHTKSLVFFSGRTICLCVCFPLLVLMRYWFVRPGWSTSWTQLASSAASSSRGVNTP